MAGTETPETPETPAGQAAQVRSRGGSGFRFFGSIGSAANGAEDYRMLLTVIAGLSLGVAATAMPVLIEGPFATWLYPAKVAMWLTGIAATVLEYLAVSFGSRLYLQRVEVIATASLSFVFLAQAGMFVVLTMGSENLSTRWFIMFATFTIFSGLEAEHARRVVLKHAPPSFPPEVVRSYTRSLRKIAILVLVVGALSLVYAIAWSGAPTYVVFIASVLALAWTVAANVQQRNIREKLAQHGII